MSAEELPAVAYSVPATFRRGDYLLLIDVKKRLSHYLTVPKVSPETLAMVGVLERAIVVAQAMEPPTDPVTVD